MHMATRQLPCRQYAKLQRDRAVTCTQAGAHRDKHVAGILDRNGGLIAQLEVPVNQARYARLLGLVAERAPGRR
jgi:hypothetical protein